MKSNRQLKMNKLRLSNDNQQQSRTKKRSNFEFLLFVITIRSNCRYDRLTRK